MNEVMKRGLNELKLLFRQSLTNMVGEYDVARIVGYLGAALGYVVYLGAGLYTVVKENHLPWVEWATGFSILSAACIAAAAGVAIKGNQERKPGDPDPSASPPQ